MRWILRDYMNKKHIESFRELSRQTGIEYRTLMNHISDVGNFRLFEIMALNEILKFTDEDLVRILREAK